MQVQCLYFSQYILWRSPSPVSVALFSTMSLFSTYYNAIEPYQQARAHTISLIKTETPIQKGWSPRIVISKEMVPRCASRIPVSSMHVHDSWVVADGSPAMPPWLRN